VNSQFSLVDEVLENGVLGNYDPMQSELADKVTFEEFGSTKLPNCR
jgi:hypothetical protein